MGSSHWELLVMLLVAVPLVLATAVAGQLPDHLKALCPAYPNCDNALLAAYDKIYQDSLAPAGGPQAPLATSAELPCANYPFCDVNHAALAQGLPCANFPNCDVHHVAIAQRGKRQAPAATPVTPGTIPGLIPGSDAAAQWWAAIIAHQGQLAHHVSKRQATIPLTPGNIPGLVPGSAAAAQWWAAQLIHQGQLAHHVSKRETPAAIPLTPGNIPGLVPGSAAAAQWWAAQLIHRG